MDKKLTQKMKEKLKRFGINADGSELVDGTPNKIKLGLNTKGSEPLHAMVKRMIRENTDAYAMQTGAETFEEANDFDIDEDPMIEAKYEKDFDTQVPDVVMKNHIKKLQEKLEASGKEIKMLEGKLDGKMKEKANESKDNG
jgi:hypothetical protein